MGARAKGGKSPNERPLNWRRGIARLKMPKPVRPSRLLEALRRAQAAPDSPSLPRRRKVRAVP
jgi:hypothetical protein